MIVILHFLNTGAPIWVPEFILRWMPCQENIFQPTLWKLLELRWDIVQDQLFSTWEKPVLPSQKKSPWNLTATQSNPTLGTLVYHKDVNPGSACRNLWSLPKAQNDIKRERCSVFLFPSFPLWKGCQVTASSWQALFIAGVRKIYSLAPPWPWDWNASLVW